MKTQIKKIISIIISVIMIFSVISVSAAAKETDNFSEETIVTENETGEEPAITTDNKDDSGYFDGMSFSQATAVTLEMFLEGIAAIPLLVLSPLGFIILPPIGVAMFTPTLIGFVAVYEYFAAIFTGEFWK